MFSQVSLTFPRHLVGRAVWRDLYSVRLFSHLQLKHNAHLDYNRPKPKSPAPWSIISKTETDIETMKAAAADPILMLVSDWTQFKSWEYMAAEENANFAVLLVISKFKRKGVYADIAHSCVDSILVNGKGSVYCPGEEYLVNHTSTYMKYALYPGHVNDKGSVLLRHNLHENFLNDIQLLSIYEVYRRCVPR